MVSADIGSINAACGDSDHWRRVNPYSEFGTSRLISIGRKYSLETIWRIVLSMASPAMITGLILAIARAAGRGCTIDAGGGGKNCSSFTVDAEFPCSLERKFMHFRFSYLWCGFQTTNIETAPFGLCNIIFAVTVIVALNLTAISICNNLREKYRTQRLTCFLLIKLWAIKLRWMSTIYLTSKPQFQLKVWVFLWSDKSVERYLHAF